MMYLEIARLCWLAVGKKGTFETDRENIDLMMVQQYYHLIVPNETIVSEIVATIEVKLLRRVRLLLLCIMLL